MRLFRLLSRFHRKAWPKVYKAMILDLLSYFDVRAYMKLYARHLESRGVKFEGAPIYISHSCSFDGADYTLYSFGKDLVISSNVRLMTHDYSPACALRAIGQVEKSESFALRGITVGNNCFIGYGSILLPGTTLGDNVIVGAGTVVRGSVPSDSIIVGNPHQVIDVTTQYAEKVRKRIESGMLESDPDFW
jgi:acetyltransferase-like isoleucine patch superfamily enzyme